jgi:hypothetical protein
LKNPWSVPVPFLHSPVHQKNHQKFVHVYSSVYFTLARSRSVSTCTQICKKCGLLMPKFANCTRARARRSTKSTRNASWGVRTSFLLRSWTGKETTKFEKKGERWGWRPVSFTYFSVSFFFPLFFTSRNYRAS